LSKETAVKTAVVAVVGAAGVAAWRMNVPAGGKLPAEALDSQLVLRAEHGFVVLVVLLFAAVVLINGIWDGELPSKLSREGAEYPVKQAASQAEKAVEGLAQLSNRRWQILRRVAVGQEKRLDALEGRIEQLEN
jgi:hypothetical protein